MVRLQTLDRSSACLVVLDEGCKTIGVMVPFAVGLELKEVFGFIVLRDQHTEVPFLCY